MCHELNFWVIGGDLRQVKLAELLMEDGHSVHSYGLEGAPESRVPAEPGLAGVELADCVILPLPAEGEGGRINAPLSQGEISLEEVLNRLPTGILVCAGMAGPDLVEGASARGLELRDYFAREELTVANAVPTAEGAVQIAMEELPITLHGARALVLGYGRVGKLTAHRLSVLGAQVTVAARKCADLAWAQAFGYRAEPIGELDGWLCAYDLVINTVPTPVLTRPRLADLKPECLVIDLASKPGGVDFEAAAHLGRRVIWALSLPGKVAPVTAGRNIKDTIYNILREEGA